MNVQFCLALFGGYAKKIHSLNGDINPPLLNVPFTIRINQNMHYQISGQISSMVSGRPDITFTAVTEVDLTRLNELVNDPNIVRYLDLISPVNIERTHAFFSLAQEQGYSLWNIQIPKAVTIGGVGLFPGDSATKFSRTATFFLYLLPAYWGKGIGEATVRFLEAEATKRRLHRLECQVVAGNSRALRLYERLGFVREGVKRDAFLRVLSTRTSS